MTKKSIVLAALAAGMTLSSSAFAANTISVLAGCAMNGTSFGLCVDMASGSTDVAHVQDNTPDQEKTFRANWWVDPNSIAMPPNSDFVMLGCNGPFAPESSAMRVFLLRDSTGTSYRLRGYARNNPGSPTNWERTSALTIGDASRNIEVQWKASDPPPASPNGFITIRRLDNGNSQTASNVANDMHVFNRCAFGAVTSIEGTANGRVFLDQYASFR